MTKASDKVMTRVMNLLNLANDPNATEAERALAGEHAERLMAQHMIDRMDLTVEEKSKAIQDTWDLNVGDSAEFGGHILSLMQNVLKHCGIRTHPVPKYGEREDGRPDYRIRRYTVVGFPEDLAYAEAIWFRVFREFVSNVSPQWDVSKSLSDNTYHFIKAGFSWIDTYKIARRAQYGDWPAEMPNGGPVLRRAYKAALEEREESFEKTRRRDAYRNSFVQSYTATICDRLVTMRRSAKESVSDSDKYALAIRSTKEQIDEEFYRLFPEYDPNVRQRMREAADFEAACAFAELDEATQLRLTKAEAEKQRREEAAWRKAAGRARRNYGSVRTKDNYDHAAWARGAAVGNKVNLSNDAQVKHTKKGELE